MRDNAGIAKRRVLRTHYWVEFGSGKSIKKCHKCGSLKKLITIDGKAVTSYEKNGEVVFISPECDDINYNN